MPRAETHRPAAIRRREALLHAALELAAEEGISGVTHRAVAARAGVAASNTTYFFDSLSDLVDEAVGKFTEEWAQLDHAFATDLVTETTPGAAATQYAKVLAQRIGAHTMAGFEVALYAARHPGARLTIANAMAAFESSTADTLRRLGAARPDDDARSFLALSDGFSLQRLANPRDTDEAQFRRGLLALAIAAMMDDAELAVWYERLGANAQFGSGTEQASPSA